MKTPSVINITKNEMVSTQEIIPISPNEVKIIVKNILTCSAHIIMPLKTPEKIMKEMVANRLYTCLNGSLQQTAMEDNYDHESAQKKNWIFNSINSGEINLP